MALTCESRGQVRGPHASRRALGGGIGRAARALPLVSALWSCPRRCDRELGAVWFWRCVRERPPPAELRPDALRPYAPCPIAHVTGRDTMRGRPHTTALVAGPALTAVLAIGLLIHPLVNGSAMPAGV